MTIDERPLRLADPLHVTAAADLEELILATVELRRQLVTHEAVCRQVLSDVREQAVIGPVLPVVRADLWRSATTDAIKEFEGTRHRARLARVAMSVDEGMTIAEIARSWGVSRQLASRWVRESGCGAAPCVGPEPTVVQL